MGFLKLLILLTFSLLFGDAKSTKNPYCSITCGEKHDINYFCELLNINVENKHCQLVLISDEMRTDILRYFNALRNERALTQDDISQGAANMNLLNYDIELEFLARAQGRFCANSEKITPSCMRTRYLYVDYIHTALMYNSLDTKFVRPNGFQEQILPTLELWRRWPYDNDTLQRVYTHKYRDLKVALMYWGELDSLGCALFRSAIKQGDMDLSLDCVCMFGSTVAPSRIPGDNVFEEGYPCSKCRSTLACSSDEFKGLCGEPDTLKNAYFKWQSIFWKTDLPEKPLFANKVQDDDK